jgi:hypothetical protein
VYFTVLVIRQPSVRGIFLPASAEQLGDALDVNNTFESDGPVRFTTSSSNPDIADMETNCFALRRPFANELEDMIVRRWV